MFTNADVLHCMDSVSSHAALGLDTVGAGIIKGIDRGSLGNAIQIDGLEALPLSGRSNVEFLTTNPAEDQAGVWGGNISIPLSLFKDVGGFDEKYVGWGAEDANLVERLVKKGASVRWVKGSVGRHLEHDFRDYHRKAEGVRRYKEKV